MALFGEGKVGQFASSIGVDSSAAAGGLAEVLPQMLDEASSGGELLEGMGGVGSLLGAAKSFLT